MSSTSSPPPSASLPKATQRAQPSPSTSSSLQALNTVAPSMSPMPQRQSSLAKDRLSTYSMGSQASQKFSRRSSHAGMLFRSSLPYAQVRDFAYPATYHMHYGPPPISSATPSGTSTPPFETQMRLHDLPSISSDPVRTSWTAGAWAGGNEQLPQTAYRGEDDHGPPYSEDEDLHSPVVVTSRHRKYPGDGPTPEFDKDRGYFTGVNGDGSETYYVSSADDMADGPGGELVTYDTDDPRHSSSILSPDAYLTQRRLEPLSGASDGSRYSRDYQFTIASPDEEMHGKAVALFDFERENENELPLVEGQVIWVSYRHGQGWLVAEDPRTRESGLVPEEYVRLLRDIEGGLYSLSGDGVPGSDDVSPIAEGGESSLLSPTGTSHRISGVGEKQPPVVSTFSTSSKDLDPYPHPLLGSETGQQPPQVVHYGTQVTPPSPDVARRSSGKDLKHASNAKVVPDLKRSASQGSRDSKSSKGKHDSLR